MVVGRLGIWTFQDGLIYDIFVNTEFCIYTNKGVCVCVCGVCACACVLVELALYFGTFATFLVIPLSLLWAD